jgi:predicted tellurium resistance membrane protein TerC
MEWIFETQAWISLLTLTALEIVLGIDNIVFITILAGKLPHEQREKAKVIGLGLAMLSRILLLLSLTWIMRLSTPLFTVLGNEISGRDLILIIGGLFLIGKSTSEIHDKLEGETEHVQVKRAAASFAGILVQIMLLDIVFSLDSVITAVGLASRVSIMVLAVVISVVIMMFAVGKVSRFVDSHPTIKMLALSFLLLIGTTLVAEGVEVHFPKGYIYFAMAFSIFVETLNLRMRKSTEPVELHKSYPQ